MRDHWTFYDNSLQDLFFFVDRFSPHFPWDARSPSMSIELTSRLIFTEFLWDNFALRGGYSVHRKKSGMQPNKKVDLCTLSVWSSCEYSPIRLLISQAYSAYGDRTAIEPEIQCVNGILYAFILPFGGESPLPSSCYWAHLRRLIEVNGNDEQKISWFIY